MEKKKIVKHLRKEQPERIPSVTDVTKSWTAGVDRRRSDDRKLSNSRPKAGSPPSRICWRRATWPGPTEGLPGCSTTKTLSVAVDGPALPQSSNKGRVGSNDVISSPVKRGRERGAVGAVLRAAPERSWNDEIYCAQEILTQALTMIEQPTWYRSLAGRVKDKKSSTYWLDPLQPTKVRHQGRFPKDGIYSNRRHYLLH